MSDVRNTTKVEENEEKTVRLHIYVPQSEIDAIDDWSFKNRIRARSKAIRRLVQLGLEVSKAKSEG